MIAGIDKYFIPLTLETGTPGVDGWNNPKMTYAAAGTISGIIRELSGDEVRAGGKDTPVSTHRMYCRKTAIKQSDRILFENKTYEVTDINDVMNFGQLLQIGLVLIQ